MKKLQGFSLIELMIVVGIIGILSLIALPLYQNYTMKVAFTEFIHMTTFSRQDDIELAETFNETKYSSTEANNILDTEENQRENNICPIIKSKYNFFKDAECFVTITLYQPVNSSSPHGLLFLYHLSELSPSYKPGWGFMYDKDVARITVINAAGLPNNLQYEWTDYNTGASWIEEAPTDPRFCSTDMVGYNPATLAKIPKICHSAYAFNTLFLDRIVRYKL